MTFILKKGGFALWVILLIGAVIAFIYFSSNFAKYGNFLGNPNAVQIDLIELLSAGNLYDGKQVCTKGYFVENGDYFVLKVSLREDEFTRSAWINTNGKKIIRDSIYPNQTKYVEAQICGKFQSMRGGEFGTPAVWNHQITVDSYKTFSDPQLLKN